MSADSNNHEFTPENTNFCNRKTENSEKQKPVYVLLESENLNHIQAPLKTTQRIKYTCFCASEKLLVFGATSGGLYIFKREPCSFQQLIPSKDGAVTRIAISQDDQFLAYSSTKGLIVVLEIQGGRRLQVSQEHLGTTVTALQWGGNELFIGDSFGRVSLCVVHLFTGKNFFQTPCVQLMQLDSLVVQLHWYRQLLLISTLTRTYVSDTRKEQYKPVGQKLRDGEYGGCVLNDGRIFCARPGCRIWEVQEDGVVQSTHQFKQTLANTTSTNIISTSNKTICRQSSNKTQFNFTKLLSLGAAEYLLSFEQDALYILDPNNVQVVIWTNDIDNIEDVQTVNDIIYIWQKNGSRLHVIQLTTVEKTVMRLYFRKYYELCGEICFKYAAHLLENNTKIHLLHDLGEKLTELGLSDLKIRILPVLEYISSTQSKNHTKLKSGIYLVGNGYSVENGNNLDTRISKNKYERARSLSISPSRRQRNTETLSRGSSTQSLDEDEPFSVITSPESIAALKELTQILSLKFSNSTKTLRDKWHRLEHKVKLFSHENMQLFDVAATSSYTGSVSALDKIFENDTQPEYETVMPRGRKPKKEINYPTLDLDRMNEIFKRSKVEETTEELILELIHVLDQFYNKNKASSWLVVEVKQSFPYLNYFVEETIPIISNSILFSLENKSIISLVVDKWLNQIDLNEEIPELFKKLYSEEDLKRDILLSRFITANCGILNIERVLEIIDSYPCCFVTWCSLLNNFQQDLLTFITTESRENIRNLITADSFPLVKLLNVMYLILRVNSSEGIDICFSIGERVSIRYFCYIVLKLNQQKSLESPDKNIKKYCQHIFLSYMDKLISNNRDVKSQCFSSDIQVYEYLISTYLQINCLEKSVCDCGFPQPGSLRNLPNLQYHKLGEYILEHFKATNLDIFKSLCAKLGLWRDVITQNNLLKYVVQLDSEVLLEEEITKKSQIIDILKIKSKFNDNKCLNCKAKLIASENKHLNWTYLAIFAVKIIGANDTCDLLAEMLPANIKLGERFYQTCIWSEVLSSYGENSNVLLVNSIKSCLIKKDMQLFSSEIAGQVYEALNRDLIFDKDVEIKPPVSGPHHWGVRTRFRDPQQHCPRCTLPLTDLVLLNTGGLRVFPCGHVLHSTCNKSALCDICDDKL